jgi:hypothetical protein
MLEFHQELDIHQEGARPVPSTLRSRLRSTLRSPRRLPVAAGAAVVVLAAGALAGCTGSGSSDSADGEGKSSPAGAATVSPAPPGKYRTLPQPCTAVDLNSLKKLVPGDKDYSGTEALTYDTDRLVGCSWKVAAADGASSSLSLSVVRVVSYDPAVSDEVQAESDFDQKASAASIPPTPSSGSQTPSAPTTPSGSPSDTTSGSSGSSGSSNSTASGANPSSTSTSTGTPNGANDTKNVDSSSPELAPRHLAHVGNTAFINDVLKSRASGSSRTVTLVFRTANVLATVTYSQSSARHAQPPKSADLQKEAQKVAGELEKKVEG